MRFTYERVSLHLLRDSRGDNGHPIAGELEITLYLHHSRGSIEMEKLASLMYWTQTCGGNVLFPGPPDGLGGSPFPSWPA